MCGMPFRQFKIKSFVVQIPKSAATFGRRKLSAVISNESYVIGTHQIPELKILSYIILFCRTGRYCNSFFFQDI